MPRITKWKDDFPEVAEGLARRKFKNKDIAQTFGVTEKTFQNWLKQKQDLVEALDRGRKPIIFDVENKMLELARGTTIKETYTMYNPPVDEFSPPTIKSINVVEKQLPPNYNAMMAWLRTYDPTVWREVKEFDIHDRRASQEQVSKIAERLKTVPQKTLLGMVDTYKEMVKRETTETDGS